MTVVKEHKKNYLASLVLTLVLWLVLAAVIWWVDPQEIADSPIPRGYLAFFLVLFLAVLFSASLILTNTRRGLLLAIGVVIFGYLKLWRINNWINTTSLAVILVVVEVYFWGRETSDTI